MIPGGIARLRAAQVSGEPRCTRQTKVAACGRTFARGSAAQGVALPLAKAGSGDAVVVPDEHDPSDQSSWPIRRARSKSLPVRPPAECVERVSVTLFHWTVRSGWWFADSAR